MATIFSTYSDAQLYELFSAENWHSDQMTDEQRQQALQELSDRTADANGTSRPDVELSQETDPYGAFNNSKSVISLNEDFINKGVYEDVESGKSIPIKASNLHAMATVFHENEHAHQWEFIQAEDKEGEELRRQLDMRANLHNYIQPETDLDLYRIQISEREANEAGDRKTMEAMKLVAQNHDGQPDRNMKDYAGFTDKSYQDSLANAQYRYNDSNIEQTMQRAMNDLEYHNRSIPENLTPSYYQIRTLFAAQEVNNIQRYMQEHPELDQNTKEYFDRVIVARFQEMEEIEKALDRTELLSMEDRTLNAELDGASETVAVSEAETAPAEETAGEAYEEHSGDTGVDTNSFGTPEAATDTGGERFMPPEEFGVSSGTGNDVGTSNGNVVGTSNGNSAGDGAGDDDGNDMSM